MHEHLKLNKGKQYGEMFSSKSFDWTNIVLRNSVVSGVEYEWYVQ